MRIRCRNASRSIQSACAHRRTWAGGTPLGSMAAIEVDKIHVAAGAGNLKRHVRGSVGRLAYWGCSGDICKVVKRRANSMRARTQEREREILGARWRKTNPLDWRVAIGRAPFPLVLCNRCFLSFLFRRRRALLFLIEGEYAKG